MAGLYADQLSDAFLESFLPETIYLVQDDVHPTATVPEAAQETAAPVKAETNLVAIQASVTVATEQAKAEVNPAAHPKYNVEGENKKGVVVLVTLPDAAFQKLPKLGMLQKMLASIGFKPEDVAYVNNVSGELTVFEELQKLLAVKYIISFASRIDTRLPHDKFTLYNPVKVADVPVVFSQSLDVLEKDVDHRKKLWEVFQLVFLNKN